MAQNPKRSIVAVNASNGAQVSITSTAGSRRVVIRECPPDGGTFNGANFNPQGLNYSLPDDNFTHVYALAPGDEIGIGDQIPEGKGAGPLIGGPAQTDPAGRTIPARIYAKVISATITPTQVSVFEYA